jgi:hypothetical protein
MITCPFALSLAADPFSVQEAVLLNPSKVCVTGVWATAPVAVKNQTMAASQMLLLVFITISDLPFLVFGGSYP